MSDPSYPAAPTTKARPSSVTISSYLLFAVAALQLINVIIALSFIGKTRNVYKELYAGTSAAGAESAVTIFAVVAAAIALLLAIGLVVLGLLNNRGKNASRIVTWVIGGLGICCTGFNLAGSAFTNSMGGSGTGDVPSASEVQRRLNEVLPSWYGPVTTTLSVLSLLALLAALILLALPASNEFFRKPKPGWEPPVPGAVFPGYPQPNPSAAHPAEPGYPSHPQAPGPSPTPGQYGGPGPSQPPGQAPTNPYDPGHPGTDRPGDQSGPPAPWAG